jgi:hypothetical protein
MYCFPTLLTQFAICTFVCHGPNQSFKEMTANWDQVKLRSDWVDNRPDMDDIAIRLQENRAIWYTEKGEVVWMIAEPSGCQSKGEVK